MVRRRRRSGKDDVNNGSLRLGRWLGIRVNVHWSVAVSGMLLGSSLAGGLGWPAALGGVVLFLASILAHEFSHALTARHFGVETESIQLWALGGLARLRSEAPSARAEGWIAVAGTVLFICGASSAFLGLIGAMLGFAGLFGANRSRAAAIVGLLLGLGGVCLFLAVLSAVRGG